MFKLPFCAALFLPLPCLANNTLPAEVITVTAQRSPQLLKESVKSIAVISDIEVQNINATHIQQVLNRQAGVNFHRNSGQEYLAAIRSPVLTGAGACGSTLMLENGIPLRPIGFCNVNELFEAHTEQANTIEIIKGPATAFYGSNGLHGVVNIIEPASFSRDNKFRLSFGDNEYISAAIQGSNDTLAYSTTIEHDGGFRDDSGYQQQKLSLQHRTDIGGTKVNSYFTAFHLNQETAGYLVGEGSYKSKTLVTQNPDPEAYRKAHGFRFHQQYQFDNGFILKPYFRLSEMEFLQHFLPGKPVEKSEQVSLGLQSQIKYQLNDKTSVSYGVDGEYAQIKLLQEQLNATTGSAFLIATIPQGKHYDYTVDILTVAPLLQLTHQVTDKLRLSAGGRLEYSHFNYRNKMNSGRVDEQGNTCGFGGCRYTRPDDSRDAFSAFSPKLAASYQINQQQHLSLNLSHGFRMPQTSELYRLQKEQQITDLAPEEIQGVESSWRYSADSFYVEANVYAFNKQNVIVRNKDSFNVMGSATRHKGVELAVSNELSANIKWLINGSYSVHQYKNNPNISSQAIVGNDIDSAPRTMANAFLTYENQHWWAELHTQYVGKYFIDIENEHKYAGHVLHHLRSKYQVTTDFSLAFNILNLADKRYAERADFSGFSGVRYFPGQGRHMKASMSYHF